MAPPKIPIRARVDRRSQRDGIHLRWDGRIRRGRPYLKGVGNAVRVLLDVADPGIQVRNTCGLERCIEPHHYRAIVETPFKFDDRQKPPWCDPRIGKSASFNNLEVEQIEFEVQQLVSGESTEADLVECGFKPEMQTENRAERSAVAPAPGQNPPQHPPAVPAAGPARGRDGVRDHGSRTGPGAGAGEGECCALRDRGGKAGPLAGF